MLVYMALSLRAPIKKAPEAAENGNIAMVNEQHQRNTKCSTNKGIPQHQSRPRALKTEQQRTNKNHTKRNNVYTHIYTRAATGNATRPAKVAPSVAVTVYMHNT